MPPPPLNKSEATLARDVELFVSKGVDEKRQRKIAGITLNADEDVLRREINKSLTDLWMHEAGSGWTRAAMLLGSSQASLILIAQMSKAIVDQNKVIIRQNELLYRAIKDLNSKVGDKEKN